MSLVVVGASHRSASVAVLEQLAVACADVPNVLHELFDAPHVSEATVLSTCNRVEMYVEAERFHGAVQDVSEVLARRSGVSIEDLADRLYVHYDERAVAHLFAVACGLDSMVVGESQILGQLRAAFRIAQREQVVGRALHDAVQQALRVGKRAHSETGIDRVGASIVSVGLQLAANELGDVAGKSGLVVGAGSMGALAASALRRADLAEIVVVNRTPSSATRLAASVGGRPRPMSELLDAMRDADVVVCVTGATGLVVTADDVRTAMTGRPERPLFVLDLALPRDVDPVVREIDGVCLADLDALVEVTADASTADAVDEVRRIVAEEVAAYLTWQRATRVAPTVVALRSMADDVVAAELARLAARLPALDERARAEVSATVRRVVDKLLHAPTVRVKELADQPDGDRYAAALRELFGLAIDDEMAASDVVRAEPAASEVSDIVAASTSLADVLPGQVGQP